MSALQEMAAKMRTEAEALGPQRLELQQRRSKITDELNALDGELHRIAQRYSDLHTAAMALESL